MPDFSDWTLWHWLTAGGLLVAMALAGAVLYIGVSYSLLIVRVFEENPAPPTLGNHFKPTVPVRGEEVDFLSTDGVRLRGVFLRSVAAKRPGRGIVVFCHEYGSDRHSAGRYCGALLDAGFTVFSFDFRNHGDSDTRPDYRATQWASNRDVRDLRGALWFLDEYLEKRGLAEPLGLFGISRGAAVAVLATLYHPEIRGVVVDGIYSTDAIIEGLMKRWVTIFSKFKRLAARVPDCVYRMFRWILMQTAYVKHRSKYPSVQKALGRMTPRPICFIHGQRDNYISQEHVRRLFELAPEPKLLWIAPEAKHNQSIDVDPEHYGRLIAGLFKRAFEPTAGVPLRSPSRRKRRTAGQAG
jgi:pimeloyl-ACP methyl ester carboxylesterase